ncbi:hypothetical protein [Azospirillum sp. SYSU D00513]|uniref:hypothetical protein n=1 Tax=Azospirillum sp. SYSU D00513 TaxID=2812561 RepID=UPI001A97681B|nr:hypothetical protein [Azospirillum sp. SYSU D00513]
MANGNPQQPGQGGLGGRTGNNEGDQGGSLTPGFGGATDSGIRDGDPAAPADPYVPGGTDRPGEAHKGEAHKKDGDGNADLPMGDDPDSQNMPA